MAGKKNGSLHGVSTSLQMWAQRKTNFSMLWDAPRKSGFCPGEIIYFHHRTLWSSFPLYRKSRLCNKGYCFFPHESTLFYYALFVYEAHLQIIHHQVPWDGVHQGHWHQETRFWPCVPVCGLKQCGTRPGLDLLEGSVAQHYGLVSKSQGFSQLHIHMTTIQGNSYIALRHNTHTITWLSVYKYK